MQSNSTLGEIARESQAATRVFLRHRLDFCCGGHRTLAEACELAALDPADIEQELAREVERGGPSTRWDDRSQTELADHIEQHYHAALRRDLPPLIDAARRIERVHAGKPGVPAGLVDVLTAFFTEMQNHMTKEERVVFPLIRRGAHSELMHLPVRVLMSEHESHGQYLANIRELTDDLRLPAAACATWTALYAGLGTVEAELMQHIHLENNILFARALRAH